MFLSNSKVFFSFSTKNKLFNQKKPQLMSTTPLRISTYTPNKAKAANEQGAKKRGDQDHGGRFKDFCDTCDKNRDIKVLMNEWVKSLPGADVKKTRSGRSHRVMKAQGQLHNDLRANIPKKSGLRNMLIEQGFTPEKLTLTWAVCYVNNIKADETKQGWEKFECSHLCCDFDESGKMTEHRCIDPNCLVWESKSVNQSRATCHRNKCTHCNNGKGCDKTICDANGLHKPPCH
jgi:hypothetical protein